MSILLNVSSRRHVQECALSSAFPKGRKIVIVGGVAGGGSAAARYGYASGAKD